MEDAEGPGMNVRDGLLITSGFCVALAAVLLLSTTAPPVSAFSGGDGSSGNPYIITTVEELDNVRNNLTAHYALGNDIDASDTVNWNNGAGFVPIGTSANRFTGSFDGRGYKITNLFINRSGTNDVGLFGAVGAGGVVKNVGAGGRKRDWSDLYWWARRVE